MWYQKIIEKIFNAKSDILLLVDPLGFLEMDPINQKIQNKYPIILNYQNEVQLRKNIREKENKIIVFKKESDIPWDLASKFGVLHININDIFPLLDNNVLSSTPPKYFPKIHEEYRNLTKNRYTPLSKKETEKFLSKILETSPDLEHETRIHELKTKLYELLHKPVNHCSWSDTAGKIANNFGELMFLINSTKTKVEIETYPEIETKINDLLKKYIEYDLYETLAFNNQSYLNSNIINHAFQTKNQRTALISFDCMGFQEWHAVKKYLQGNLDVTFKESYSFSMLPSETNYSSTSLFAGMLPKEIREHGKTLHWKNEETLFKYTLNKEFGLSPHEIFFQRCGNPNELSVNLDSFKDYKAVGLVFSFIDRLAHNKEMDKQMLVNNINIYLDKTNLQNVISHLLAQNFRVYFVSDHGNIFAKGNGIRVSSDLVESKAKRCLIYDNKSLAAEKTEQIDGALLKQLKPINGEEFLVLLTGKDMLASKSQSMLTHGGISIQEVVLPFIEVINHERV